MVLGQQYDLREWHKPVKPALVGVSYQPDRGPRYGPGFPGFWTTRQVTVVARLGQKLVVESMQWKCVARDRETLRCTWVKELVRETVPARDLR